MARRAGARQVSATAPGIIIPAGRIARLRGNEQGAQRCRMMGCSSPCPLAQRNTDPRRPACRKSRAASQNGDISSRLRNHVVCDTNPSRRMHLFGDTSQRAQRSVWIAEHGLARSEAATARRISGRAAWRGRRVRAAPACRVRPPRRVAGRPVEARGAGPAVRRSARPIPPPCRRPAAPRSAGSARSRRRQKRKGPCVTDRRSIVRARRARQGSRARYPRFAWLPRLHDAPHPSGPRPVPVRRAGCADPGAGGRNAGREL